MKRLAVLLVWCGLVCALAGVWMLAGYAWALIAVGVLAVAIGLAFVDVDEKDGGGKPT